jgi:hypothetical protein
MPLKIQHNYVTHITIVKLPLLLLLLVKLRVNLDYNYVIILYHVPSVLSSVGL